MFVLQEHKSHGLDNTSANISETNQLLIQPTSASVATTLI